MAEQKAGGVSLLDDWNATFVHVTRCHWDTLLRFACSLAHVRHDADDLLQTSLLKGLQSFPRFVENNLPGVHTPDEALRAFQRPENATHLRHWLFKILKNSFLDHCDKQKRLSGEEAFDQALVNHESVEGSWHGQATRPFHVEAEFAGNQKISNSELASLEQAFFQAALDDHWEAKFAGLSSRQRSVVFLAAEGYAYKEIATLLDIPIGTVMSSLSRALQKLKKADLRSDETSLGNKTAHSDVSRAQGSELHQDNA